MKLFYIGLLLLIFRMPVAICQSGQNIDSLNRLLGQTREDTRRVLLLNQIASNYLFLNPDSAIIIVQQAIGLAQKLHFDKGKVRAMIIYGEAQRFQGEFPRSLEAQFNALEMVKSMHDREDETVCLGNIGMVYLELNQYREAINYLQQARAINEIVSDNLLEVRWLSGIGYAYLKMNMLDSSLSFQQQAYDFLKTSDEPYTIRSLVLTRLGIIHSRLGHLEIALQFFKDAIKNTRINGDLLNRGRTQYQIAEFYYTVNQVDSSLHYSRLAFENGTRMSQNRILLDASSLMVKLYTSQNKLDSAFHYQHIAMTTNDSLYGREKFQQLQLLILNEQQHQQQFREKQVQFERISLVSALAFFILMALLLWRNIMQQKHTNKALNIKNDQIEAQRISLEKTLSDLKSTQSQLIQSEKMASLGQLTAGIAHEIQNPLNFINNFSEVNTELIGEMQEEMEKENLADAKAILIDLKENEQKINHHGKRADAIVKGMLQHSQTSSGIKEPVDINKLADEYLRLAYHTFRAKDKSFHATLKTDYDATIGNINSIPQDMGKVLLNLCNNAFYAVAEKKKLQPENFEPMVSVTTRNLSVAPGSGGKIEIRVADNGNGIAAKVADKIFQPFFTTKPTGQGTGLGLSLAYDIIKAHGGQIQVDTTEGKRTEFVIQLPRTA